MPSHHKCAVKGRQVCDSVWHRFPNPGKFISVFWQWINCIGNEAFLCLEPIVCHTHFTEDDTYTNNTLKKDAVPSLNLPEPQTFPISKGIIGCKYY
nr:unnamed protein product [Callosobruchus analis]